MVSIEGSNSFERKRTGARIGPRAPRMLTAVWFFFATVTSHGPASRRTTAAARPRESVGTSIAPPAPSIRTCALATGTSTPRRSHVTTSTVSTIVSVSVSARTTVSARPPSRGPVAVPLAAASNDDLAHAAAATQPTAAMIRRVRTLFVDSREGPRPSGMADHKVIARDPQARVARRRIEDASVVRRPRTP